MHKNNGGSTMPHRGFVLPLSKKLRDPAKYLVVGSSFYVWLAVRAVVVCSVNLCVIKPGPIICGLPLVVSLTIKIAAAPNN